MLRKSLFLFLSVLVFSQTSCQKSRKVEGNVLSGLDVLIENNFVTLAGKNIGLVTNQTAVARDGRHAIDVLHQARACNLVALFGPEHGIRGSEEAGQSLTSGKDAKTGLPIFSLYGAIKKPTKEMLSGIDVLVFDIQDVGTRFYTYISTMSLAMEAAAENNIEFIVLDRPNPIGGVVVEGPVLKPAFKSFVGVHEIALRHGMTIGELAILFNEQGWLAGGMRAKLNVVRMKNWRRDWYFDQTGLKWVKPSPNMVSVNTALFYPGMGLLEATNVSEGRGTDHPFELFGAPWIDALKLQQKLQQAHIPAVKTDTTSFIPVDIPGVATNPKYKNQKCYGLDLTVTDRERFLSVRFGLEVLCAIRDLYPQQFSLKERWMNLLTGTSEVYRDLHDGRSAQEIVAKWQPDLEQFKKLRQKYLLY